MHEVKSVCRFESKCTTRRPFSSTFLKTSLQTKFHWSTHSFTKWWWNTYSVAGKHSQLFFSNTKCIKFTDDLLWCYVLPLVWGLKYSDAKWNCLFFNILTWQSKMLTTQCLFAILLLHEVQNSYNHWSCSFPSSPDYVYLSLYFQHLSPWLPIYVHWINDYWMDGYMYPSFWGRQLTA